MAECVTHWRPPARHRGWQRMAFRLDSLEKSGCARTRCGGAATGPTFELQIVTPWREGATIRSMGSMPAARAEVVPGFSHYVCRELRSPHTSGLLRRSGPGDIAAQVAH